MKNEDFFVYLKKQLWNKMEVKIYFPIVLTQHLFKYLQRKVILCN